MPRPWICLLKWKGGGAKAIPDLQNVLGILMYVYIHIIELTIIVNNINGARTSGSEISTGIG